MLWLKYLVLWAGFMSRNHRYLWTFSVPFSVFITLTIFRVQV